MVLHSPLASALWVVLLSSSSFYVCVHRKLMLRMCMFMWRGGGEGSTTLTEDEVVLLVPPSFGVELFSSYSFLMAMVVQDSSYSPFEIGTCWNVIKEDKIYPPIRTEHCCSGGVTNLMSIVDGTKSRQFLRHALTVSSFVIRSPIFGTLVVPPVNATLAANSTRISTWTS